LGVEQDLDHCKFSTWAEGILMNFNVHIACTAIFHAVKKTKIDTNIISNQYTLSLEDI
jgi:hypothetical protein